MAAEQLAEETMKIEIKPLALALSLMCSPFAYCATNTWIGLNYGPSGTMATNVCDASSWSMGFVPGPGDSAAFLFNGYDGMMGDLFIDASDTDFNPTGDFVFMANNGPSGQDWRQSSDIYLDKSLTIRSFKITTGHNGSGTRLRRFLFNTIARDDSVLTITGDGEVFDVRGVDWGAIRTFGDIVFTGRNITFSDSSHGGTISVSENDDASGTVQDCSMLFDGVDSSISLGIRYKATLSLGHMGLSVRSTQEWISKPGAYISLARDGSRSILDSIDGERLDNLGDVDFSVGHSRYGDGSKLTLPPGTYGGFVFSAGGNRGYSVKLEGDTEFAGVFRTQEYGLKLYSPGSYGLAACLQTGGNDVNVSGGNLFMQTGGNIDARNGSHIFVNGDIIVTNSTGHAGIFGDTGTVVSVTGDYFLDGRSYYNGGLHESAVMAVGGGAVQEFEVGDASSLEVPQTATFSFGVFNVGTDTTNAYVRLVNKYLNNNPVVNTNDTDRLGERFVAGDLRVGFGSTFDVNGQNVYVSGLSIAPDGVLDLNNGRRLEHGEILTNFVGMGNQADVWNLMSSRVIDSSYRPSSFIAVCDVETDPAPFGAHSFLEFDGVDDFAVLSGDGLGEDLSGGFTIEAWVCVTNTAASEKWCYFVHRGYDQNLGTSVYWIGINDSMNYAGGVNGAYKDGDTGVKVSGGWHHMALSYDGAWQRVYLDGELMCESEVPEITNRTTSNKITVGAGNNNGKAFRPSGGNIAELRIWSRALDSQEITQNMDRQLTGIEPGLSGYWPMAKGYGTVLEDLSGGGNNGTMKNGLFWFGGAAHTYWQVYGPLPAGLIIVR